jgi:CMP/dCMP kinase
VIIAIDGPAGSGKSSTAREVAKRTHSLYIDTGAMYRAVALFCLRNGIDTSQPDFDSHLSELSISLKSSDNGITVWLNGEDVSDEIRSSTISEMSSIVSSNVRVRVKMVDMQREMASEALSNGGSVVMEGRDIGSVVFPDAEFKFFLIADPKVRAERRGVHVDSRELLDAILARDERDESRSASPLIRASDAIAIDTSSLSFEEQVENILSVIYGNG